MGIHVFLFCFLGGFWGFFVCFFACLVGWLIFFLDLFKIWHSHLLFLSDVSILEDLEKSVVRVKRSLRKP